MAARLDTRIMGIETEYGISALAPGSSPVPGGFGNAFVEEDLHPMQLSNHVVKAYGASTAGQPAGWDYETETPLRDIRGYEISRAAAHPDQLTDTDLGMANVILTNGARLYVDHAHPEYSSPEVTCALDAVRYDKAGESVMAIAAQRATQSLGRSVRLYKNNTDGKGASYGTHENYLLQRSTPFDRIVTQFTAFLVSRQVITGAGRVGVGQSSQTPGFQISQRADFFEAEVGLETTLNRPIQEVYLDACRNHYERIAGDLTETARIEAKDIFSRWQECIDALRTDIFSLADQLDWVAKLKLLESYRQRGARIRSTVT
jgi:Pup amidohydrolase